MEYLSIQFPYRALSHIPPINLPPFLIASIKKRFPSAGTGPEKYPLGHLDYYYYIVYSGWSASCELENGRVWEVFGVSVTFVSIRAFRNVVGSWRFWSLNISENLPVIRCSLKDLGYER